MRKRKTKRTGNRESGQFTSREEFEQHLERVKDGDLTSMDNLMADWPTKPEWRVEMMATFLTHLDTPKPRGNPVNPLEISSWILLRRVATSLDGVCHAVSLNDPKLLDLIVDNIDGILSWHEHMLSGSQSKEQPFVKTVKYLLNSDEKLLNAILSSPWIGPCLVSLVLRQAPNGPHDDLETVDNRLLIVGLLYNTLIHKLYRRAILDHFASQPKAQMNLFIKNIVAYLDDLKAYSRLAPSPKDQDILRSTMHIQKVIDVLSWDSRIRPYLVKEDYIIQFFMFLQAIRSKVLSVIRFVPMVKWWLWNGINLQSICDWLNHDPRTAPMVLCELVELGFITTMFDDLSRARREDEAKLLFNSLQVVAGHLRSDRVLAAVDEKWKALPKDVLQRLRAPGHHGAKIFEQFHVFITLNKRTLGKIEENRLVGEVDDWIPPNYCHNIPGPHVEELNDHNEMFACARCHSVVYCCKDCQTDDWEALHKYECSMLKQTRRALKQEDRWVPWKHRFRSLDGIANFMDGFFKSGQLDALNTMFAQQRPDYATLDKRRLITVHWKMSMQKERKKSNEVVTFDEYRERAKAWVPWSPKRFDALVKRVEESEGTRKLCAFVFPFGHSRLHVLFLYDASDEIDSREESRMTHGMMQLEYSSGEFTEYSCESSCCR
ncbi:hypothetical protein CC1G_09295 [Coprinopsis cinerea okayama7|uniref:MYND-type domain-containing protein n=1 Tax=Coprinopsis cinerea (strain Okayama-7 / 130 / ATCC MYA-4618 / FGSC 9003) TaxID=240176 RepID=A8N874_COPC7|nr:hypothetical protein CC1G_09295 [Coprinopsis cinerea okayama7\|eukprot:XP_001831030.2 hypothetical protein CC1G_09295 [Coprinopsis cinerea okayama7\